MGTSTYIYVGPYICSSKVEVNTTKTVRTCSNAECKIYKQHKPVQGKFCSECGGVVTPIQHSIKEMRVLRFWDIFSDDNVVIPENLQFLDQDDEFTTVEVGQEEVWLLNKREACDKIPHLSASPEYQNEIMDIDTDRDNSISQFMAYYGVLLDYVQEKFNVHLEVKYGMIVYYL